MAGDRVDRLLQALVPGRGAGVQEDAGGGQPGGPLGVEQGPAARAGGQVAGLGVGDLGGQGQPGRDPGREAAVEHAGARVAEPAEQPPGPGRPAGLALVVGDHRAVLAGPGPAHDRLERLRARQGMAATGARRGGQVPVQVDEHRPRQVALVVGGPVGPAGQLPAAVEHRGRGRAGQLGGELGGGDQRSRRHRPSLAQPQLPGVTGGTKPNLSSPG